MEPQNPRYREHATAIIRKSEFARDIGLVLDDLGPGWCETHIDILPKHMQQDGCIHAGVQATLAVAESEVFAVRGGAEKLVAKAMITLAPVRGQ